MDKYVFEMNLEKSIICEKEQPNDTPSSKIDNTPDVDTNLLKRIMLVTLPDPKRQRMQVMMSQNKEIENKENEDTES